MEITAKAIAEHLQGEIIGDSEAKVSSVSRIESGKPGTLCFLANPKYEKYIYSCKASIILINRSFQPKKAIPATLIKVDDAYQAIADFLQLLNASKSSVKRKRALSAHISLSSRLGKKVYVGSNAYIGKHTVIGNHTKINPFVFIGDNVTIGDNCLFYPGVRIYDGCKIGNNCIIQANAVIGSDGFGFAPQKDGSYKKIPQTGIVTIEDNCEIGANTVIDRSTMGTTLIEKGVKLDNLIQVAHNVIIGSNTVIAAQAGIAGSAKIGKHCMIGGQAGISGHITIADKTGLAAQSGVQGSIKEEGKAYMGSPAFEYRDYMRSYVIFKKNGQKK